MEKLRVGEQIVAGGVTLVPVERCLIESDASETICWLSGLKEPFAIIVCDTTGIRAFDTEATEISIETLIQKIPDLGAVLSTLT
jgi:hypothetical protein